LITTHSLPVDAFAELAGGGGDSAVVRHLCEAQLSKHLMLLRVVAGAADAPAAEGRSPQPLAVSAFQAGYQLLAQAQAVDPVAVARVLGLPHVGSWAHDCLACLDRGAPPDFGYLAAVAAAAAVQLDIPFELDVPVRDGRTPLPGLGCLELPGLGEWTGLSSDGERLRVGRDIEVACADLVPDDGSGAEVPHWRGTPLVRAVADGQAWEVLLECADRYLDRYTLPMLTAMTAPDLAHWRQVIQAGWELLVRHHVWAAGPVAEGVRVIVPLVPASDLDSAASPAAFGAIATSLPPSPVSMGETLVHEFQHIKLCGLMDMLPLVKPCDERGYAPWREDPRPMGGLLQGVYAFTGIVRFWSVQRQLETGPDGILRAGVLYERWRLAIKRVARDLLANDVLTPDGTRFVAMLSEQEEQPGSEPLPAESAEIAREVTLDNWLTWQLRHTAVDSAAVSGLAAAYRSGEPRDQELPATRIEDDIRKVDSVARSRLLNMRYADPGRYRELSATELPELGPADALLIRGDATAALVAYRAELAVEPDPAGWLGLALAVHRLPVISSRPVFANRLPLLFEVHRSLASLGIHADPLDLAAWFT
jgi:HEXXH motif-containing protein